MWDEGFYHSGLHDEDYDICRDCGSKNGFDEKLKAPFVEKSKPHKDDPRW